MRKHIYFMPESMTGYGLIHDLRPEFSAYQPVMQYELGSLDANDFLPGGAIRAYAQGCCIFADETPINREH